MTTPLLIALLAGPPLALLALAITYAAHVLAPRLALGDNLRGFVAQPDEAPPAARDVKLIEDLQHLVIDLQRQLIAQHDALTELLSERREEHTPPAQPTQPTADPVSADLQANPRRRPPARTGTPQSGPRRSSIDGASIPADDIGDAGSRGQRVRQLLAEGMPERSIARELRIGVEEVHLMATPGGAGRVS